MPWPALTCVTCVCSLLPTLAACCRLKEFLKKATASILMLVYCGSADQHGNWICKHDEILSFNEMSSVWNELRKVRVRVWYGGKSIRGAGVRHVCLRAESWIS